MHGRSAGRGSDGTWPNLLVIGAHKAGTTSLHHYLDAHPDVSMSARKELAYFAGPDFPVSGSRWTLGPEWYRSNFTGPAAVHGESSTDYTFYPRIPGVPRRIREAVPDVKLIYAVRDPIERFLSHYGHARGRGLERRSLPELLRSPALAESPYMVRSRYWLQLEQYLQWFDTAQVLVVSTHDLMRDRNHTLARIFRFLQVADDFRSPTWADIHNTAHRYPVQEFLGRFLGETAIFRLETKTQLTRRLLRVGQKRARRLPDVPEEMWADAKRILAPEAARLRELTGLELADWSV